MRLGEVKRYEKYKDSGVEWIGEVPEHWEISRLKYHCNSITKGTTPTTLGKEFVSDGINFIKVESVDEKFSFIPDKFAFIDDDTNTLLKRSQLKEGNLLVSIAGAIGRVGIVTKNILPANTNQALGILDLRKNENRKWIAYNIASDFQQYYYQTLTVQSAQANLSLEDIGSSYIIVPSEVEQKSIVNFLDRKTSEIDSLIADKEKLIELLQEQRQAIISEAVTKGLDKNVKMKDSGVEWIGEVPEGWDVKDLKYTVDLICKKASEKDFEKPYIGLEHIESKTGRIINIENEGVEGDTNIFQSGDILFGKLRPYLAKCFVPNFSGRCSSEFLVLRKRQIYSNFLQYLMLSDSFISIVDSSTYGAKMPRASWEFIGNLKIPIPSYEEQENIADYLDQKTSEIDFLITQNQEQIMKLKEYRQALISEAVTGKIMV